MRDLRDLTPEERWDWFAQKYHGKIFLAGSKHPQIKRIPALLNNRKANPHKCFVIEGIWGIQKVLEANLPVEAFFFAPDFVFSTEAQLLVETMIDRAEQSFLISGKVCRQISEKENSDGLLAIARLPQHQLEEIELNEQSLLVIIDGVEIPGNVGTIIRSADGAGADAILLCNRRARLTHPKVVKGSQGANLSMPIVEAEIDVLQQWLRANRFRVFLTDTDATMSYDQTRFFGRVALVAGSERYGISKEWYTADVELVKIPMRGQCDSLNVAVATGIILFAAASQMK